MPSALMKSGRLIHIGYGVYRTTQYPPSSEDQFAAAVEEVGASAYLCGESVLALHDSCVHKSHLDALCKVAVAVKSAMIEFYWAQKSNACLP